MSNQIQIGPQDNNPVISGVASGNELGFGVYPSGAPEVVYAWYSLDAGNSWLALANNYITLVEPIGNPVQWRISQTEGPVKFIITPGSPDPS